MIRRREIRRFAARYPFLLCNAIVEMERLQAVVGIKRCDHQRVTLQGHFPCGSRYACVAIIESMAQTGDALCCQEVPGRRERKLCYFVAVAWSALAYRGNGDRSRDESDFLARRFLTSWRGAPGIGQMAASQLMCR